MKATAPTLRSLLAALVLATTSTAFAQNIFRDLDTTAGGYTTWDSDLINIEAVTQTGSGVYVAVLDTGMVPNWRDYFPDARVATNLGTGFHQPVMFKAKKDVCGLGVELGTLRTDTWVGSVGSTHGTHVASTILGYFYRANADAAAGFPLPPIVVRGIAPNVTVIPIKVLADYQVPALPKCSPARPATKEVFGTDEMVAAGIRYATDLKLAGFSPMVINMSLGGSRARRQLKRRRSTMRSPTASSSWQRRETPAKAGMDYPGAYPPVISAGSAGWVREWITPTGTPQAGPRYRMWWLKNGSPSLVPPLLAGSGEVAEPTTADDVYVSDFSSRELPGQQLDVLAPGSWVRGPFPGDPGYNHLPWWSKGIGDLVGGNSGNFFYVGGTSMATPHVASVAAMMLQKNPGLTQAQVETILKTTALAIPASGTRIIFDFTVPNVSISWDTDCGGATCNAVGSGLIRADAALAATP